MPPRTQRSRACTQCRERRVKCDETPITCGPCRRRDLSCSGPVTGSIVIDMTDKISKPRARRKRENQMPDLPVRAKPPATKDDRCDALVAGLDSSKSVLDMPLPHPLFSAERRYSTPVERAVTAIRYHYKPPEFYQPSRVVPEALDSAFISHLVHINTNSITYPEVSNIEWLQILPKLYSDTPRLTFKCALRAASMAFFGKTHRDPSILVDSYRWYLSSMNAYNHSYSKIQDGHVPTDDEISIPLLLGLYCLYVGMNSTCSMDHLNVAAKLVIMAGPVKCATGVAFALFQDLRTGFALEAIWIGQPSPFSSPDWMEIPFRNKAPNARQRLANIELMVPNCMQMLHIDGGLQSFFETKIPANVDVDSCRTFAQRLLRDLDDWALENPDLTEMAQEYQNSDNSDIEPWTISHAETDAGDDTITLNKHTTLPAIMYVNTRLILNALMCKIEMETSTPQGGVASKYYEIAGQYARQILSNSTHLEKAHVPGGSLLRYIPPLMTVALIGPVAADLKESRAMLKRWVSRMGGVDTTLELNALARSPSPSTLTGILCLHVCYMARGRNMYRD